MSPAKSPGDGALAIGYITPKDMLAGRQQEIHPKRDRKSEEARKQADLSAEGRVKDDESRVQSRG